MEQILKTILFIVGFTSLVVGIAGIFLPLLPTTPFLILSAICFGRSSNKFHGWLINHPHLGSPIKDWKENRVIAIRAKIVASILISSSLVIIGFNSALSISTKSFVAIFLILIMSFIWVQKSK